MTKRNCSIDIFRYICAIMVVAIHSSPFTDINKDLGYIFTEIVPQIAVPFFFITSGYFYIKGLEKGSISALALYVCCNIRKLLKLILSSKKK